MKDTYICLTVDLERDLGAMPPQYNGIDNGLPILVDIFKDHGINITWMLSSKLIEDRAKTLKQCVNGNHEVACHGYRHELYLPSLRLPVAEYVGFGFKLRDSAMDLKVFDGFDPLPFNNKDTAFEIIDKSTTQIERFFGKRPTSFKMPYTTVDWDILSYLDSIGYPVDVSIPHWKYWDWRPPHHPYIHKIAGESDDSFYDDVEQRQSLRLLEIPISHDPHPEIVDGMMVMHRTFSMLSCRTLGLKRVEALLNSVVKQTPDNFPTIFSFKSSIWEFAEMQKVGHQELEKNVGQGAIDLLKKLLDALDARYNPEYLTLTKLANIWEKNHCPTHSII